MVVMGICVALVVLGFAFQVYELAFLMLVYIVAQLVGKAIVKENWTKAQGWETILVLFFENI